MKTREEKRNEAEKRQITHNALTDTEKARKAGSRRGRSFKELTRLSGSEANAERLISHYSTCSRKLFLPFKK